VIEIEEPPDIRACAGCARPLVWLYSYRLGVPVAFVPDPGNVRRLDVHECERWGLPPPSWRDVEQQDPATIHAGAERVRQELASKELA
jgi:hypothetical protein